MSTLISNNNITFNIYKHFKKSTRFVFILDDIRNFENVMICKKKPLL